MSDGAGQEQDQPARPVTFEEHLRTRGSLTYSTVGTSMLPLLRQGRDLVIIGRKGPDRCRVGDVVLYRRSTGQCVLHRVVAVRPADYVICGDNCAAREYGVTDRDIIGVMRGFVRDGREHTVDELGYRLYAGAVLASGPVRMGFLRGARKLRALRARLT